MILNGNVTLSSHVNITRTVTIDGNGNSLSKGLQISANDVVIENASITPSEFYPGWFYGIMVGDVTGVVIRNNVITGNNSDEIGISDITGNSNAEITITGNTISNLWTAILIDSANTDATVTGNNINDAKHGIYVSQAPTADVSISSNTISNPKALSDGSAGDAISVPNGTLAADVTAIQTNNTFTGVASGKEVVVLQP
ncbi:right-handed parallel beta-helix repeat-containing protein [Bacillus sp. ISL-41]|nr:right-handed parallel beta-helix repeat-containing protein [Bacillus sp. ISL-41]